MSTNIDFSPIRTIRIHKEQFDAIEKKADTVIVTCIEDGRCMAFSRDKVQEETQNIQEFNREKCDYNCNVTRATDVNCADYCGMKCPFEKHKQ